MQNGNPTPATRPGVANANSSATTTVAAPAAPISRTAASMPMSRTQAILTQSAPESVSATLYRETAAMIKECGM